MINHIPYITIDTLIKNLNEYKDAKLDPGQYSELSTAIVVRTLQAHNGMTHSPTNEEQSPSNVIGVVMSLKEYEKMRQAQNVIDSLFYAMDGLGLFERFE